MLDLQPHYLNPKNWENPEITTALGWTSLQSGGGACPRSPNSGGKPTFLTYQWLRFQIPVDDPFFVSYHPRNTGKEVILKFMSSNHSEVAAA